MKSDSFLLNLHHDCGGGGDDGTDVAVSSWALLTACVLRVFTITPPLYL